MTQIQASRKAMISRIRNAVLITLSVAASWAFAVSAVWGVGPFSWPADTPEPSIIADNITVNAPDSSTAAAVAPNSASSVTTASARH